MKRLNIHQHWESTELERKITNISRKEVKQGEIINMGRWYQIKLTDKK